MMRIALLSSLVAAALFACDDGGTAPIEDEPLVSVAGVSLTGDVYTVRLETSTPDPPIRGDSNAWQLTLLEGETPMDGCSFVVEPTMPAHGHGTNPDPETTPVDGVAGGYEIRPINFLMPGEWHVAIRPTCGEVTDEIVFIVEIES